VILKIPIIQRVVYVFEYSPHEGHILPMAHQTPSQPPTNPPPFLATALLLQNHTNRNLGQALNVSTSVVEKDHLLAACATSHTHMHPASKSYRQAPELIYFCGREGIKLCPLASSPLLCCTVVWRWERVIVVRRCCCVGLLWLGRMCVGLHVSFSPRGVHGVVGIG
jgi:hypothetical protein